MNLIKSTRATSPRLNKEMKERRALDLSAAKASVRPAKPILRKKPTDEALVSKT